MDKKIPEHFLKIFSDCIRLLLERINAPKKEIETITEKIYTSIPVKRRKTEFEK
jgi:hypothetical protein